MCVKLSLRDLNPGPCPPHRTSIYICGVTTAPRVRSGHAWSCMYCYKCEIMKLMCPNHENYNDRNHIVGVGLKKAWGPREDKKRKRKVRSLKSTRIMYI